MYTEGIIKRAKIIIGSTLIPIVGLIVLLVLKLKYNITTACPTFEIFGIYCPGCGGTRMAISLLHLEIYQAFRYNPFIFVTSPIMAVIYFWQSYEFIFKNRISIWLDKVLILYAILLMIFGVIRNIEIFSWLTPTIVK